MTFSISFINIYAHCNSNVTNSCITIYVMDINAGAKTRLTETTVKEGNIFWTGMTGIVYQFAFYPFLCFPAMVIFKLGASIYIVDMMKLPFALDFLARMCSMYGQAAACFEVCRITPLVLILLIMVGKMLNSVILCYQKQHSGWFNNRLVGEYSALVIAFAAMRPLLESLIGWVMGASMLALVMFTFVTIRMYSIFPLWFYIYFPSVNILVVVCLMLILSITVGVRDNCEAMLRTWLNWANSVGVQRFRMHHLQKRLKALQPIQFSARLKYCRLYYVKKSIKLKFYQQIVAYTMTLLLSIPEFNDEQERERLAAWEVFN